MNKKDKNYMREGFVDIACMIGLFAFQFSNFDSINSSFKSLINIFLIPTNLYFFGHLFYCFIKLILTQDKGALSTEKKE